MNEMAHNTIHPFYICLVGLAYILYKHRYYMEEKYYQYCYNDSCNIIITYHKRVITLYNGKTSNKITYSDKFYAVNNYLLKNKNHKLNSLYEIININDDKYGEIDLKYIFVPNNSNKILISENPDIYFENIIEQKDDSDNNSVNNNSSTVNTTAQCKNKCFTYCLSMKGKHNMQILQHFVKKCEEDYIKSRKHTQQMIYEYISTSVDDEDRKEIKFNHFVFKSNKWLDRNIFFDNKQRFIENIRKFPYRKDYCLEQPVIKTKAELEYEYYGKSFKNIILLHGQPGCGKTSVIKGILNETKRHGVVVHWSRIKKCADFSALFRNLKINEETYSLGELCYIFEDFDANKNDLLKKRKNLSETSSEISETCGHSIDMEESSEDGCDSIVNVNAKAKATVNKNNKHIMDMKKIMDMPLEDELTLDYVLNVFDGVIELYNAMIIFTTNVKLDYFDSALIRPGRIDTILEMKECSWPIILDILQHYYKLSDDMVNKYADNLVDISNITIRPCMVEEICMKSCCIEDAIKEITIFCNRIK